MQNDPTIVFPIKIKIDSASADQSADLSADQSADQIVQHSHLKTVHK